MGDPVIFFKTPEATWRDINKRYFFGELATPRFQWVEPGSLHELDTRTDLASTLMDDQGWLVSISTFLKDQPRLMYFILGHEAIHVKLPKARHKSKEWNAEVRRLQALGFFMRTFS
jgi:hypothetical protein